VSDQARDERIALNEARFREINDRVRDDLADLHEPPELIGFVCECGHLDCRGQIELTDGEYASVRSDPMQFAVVPGHEMPEAEDVVERAERFTIIRKHENVRGIVESTDPRGGGASG